VAAGFGFGSCGGKKVEKIFDGRQTDCSWCRTIRRESLGGKNVFGRKYAGRIDRSTKNSSQDRRSQFGCMQIYDEPHDAWTINDK
jgi:hypothetical protein